MLQRVTLQCVKSFLTEAIIPLAPLTLIAGTNSSGKSTVFQTLLLVKQAFEHPAFSLDGMHLNGPQASVGSYVDWCSKHALTNVIVSIALTNEPLLKMRELRRAFFVRRPRRATSPVLWWLDRGPYGRRLRFDVRMTGTFKLTFSPSTEFPNDARLKYMSWSSSATRREESATYSLCTEAAIPSDEELDAAELDSDNDAERYRYFMTASRASPGAASAISKAYCAVEGLLPTSVLSATDESAAKITIIDQIAGVFSWARSTGRTSPDHDSQTVEEEETKDTKCVTDAMFSPTKRRFQILAVKAHKATDLQASRMLGAVGELRLARAIVDRFGSPQSGSATLNVDFRDAAHAASAALLAMARRLIVARAQDPSLAADIVDSAVDANAARISATYPELEEFVRFLVEAAQLSKDAALGDGLASALDMGARHSAVDRKHLQPTSIDSALRELYTSDTPQISINAPSEDAVRRYFVEGLFHLGPLRDEPRVLYVADVPLAPHDVGKRGQRAVSCLREFGREPIEFPLPVDGPEEHAAFKSEILPLSDIVSRWGQYLGIFDGLHIDPTEKYGTLVKVKGSLDGSSISPDLTNVGVGVSQVLPILVLCAAMPAGGCALIEQPELHLHPSVQSKLAVFFAACAGSGRQVVLESHSEHLVNRIRLMIACRELHATDVSVVFVERDAYGATAVPVKIRDDGALERWPRGFLDETERVLAALMRARSASRVR